MNEFRPQLSGSGHFGMVNFGVAKRPLGGASTPLIQGASPTSKESTDD